MGKMFKSADMGVGIYLLAAILFFIVPIPSWLLDAMLAVNIGIALHIQHCCCLPRFFEFH